MNSSSENNAHFEGGNARPLFYVHAVGQQPYPSPWYQNPSYHLFSVPGAGFRNGSLCFLYSVLLSESPGFFIPQSPLPTALNRRPIFCNTAQFQQCSGYGKKMKTKETQTEHHQASNMTQRQDTHSKGDMVTSILTSDVDTEMDNIPEATDGVLFSVAQKQQLRGESPSPSTMYRTSPQVNYASEKRKMGPEQNRRFLVTQFWKTLRETLHLYDLVYGKAMPDIMVQHGGISQSSCESRSVVHNHHEGADGITCKDEESTLWSEKGHVRRDEVVKSGSIVDVNFGKEKGYAALPQLLSSPHEAKDRDEIQDTLDSNPWQPSRDGDKLKQERPVCSSNKAIEDQSLESKTWSPIHFGEGMPDNGRGGHGFPVNVDKGEVVESSSYPENYVLPSTSLAHFSQVDKGIQCDMSQWQDARHEKSPESSPESRKAKEEAVRCGELDEVVERDSYSKYVPSPAWLAQMSSRRVDEGIQCDSSWWQDAELERSPEQMPPKDEQSSPDCKTKGSQRKTIRKGRLNTDEEEMIMNDEIEEDHENFRKSAEIKKAVKGRKQKTLSNFSSRNTVYFMKKNGALNTVLPNESKDCDFQEAAEDEMYETDCLLEEVSPLGYMTSSRGRIYREAGRIIRMPPQCSLPPQLIVWPTRNKYRLKLGEHVSIPTVCKATRQEGRFRGGRTMAMQEGLESKRASHKLWECNCVRWKTEVPYKLSNRFEADAVKFTK